MKNFRFSRVALWALVCAAGVVCSTVIAAAPEPLRVQIQLIWGTDAAVSPDANHKAVDAALAKKLSKTFRWKYYYEVNRQEVAIPPGEVKKGIKMSNHCTLELKNLGQDRIETKLYGKGKHLATRQEPLVKNWPLILAGDAENDTAWLVVVKRFDPAETKTPKPGTN